MLLGGVQWEETQAALSPDIKDALDMRRKGVTPELTFRGDLKVCVW